MFDYMFQQLLAFLERVEGNLWLREIILGTRVWLRR